MYGVLDYCNELHVQQQFRCKQTNIISFVVVYVDDVFA